LPEKALMCGVLVLEDFFGLLQEVSAKKGA
jgi:hypothetical protein